MTNPSPNFITTEMWGLWLGCKQVIPGVKLSGIYASKKGYHNTRVANLKLWPGDYSIKLNYDLLGPADKAAAIDLTMSTEEMIKRTNYLRSSAIDRADWRLYCLREFIGTLDGKNVYCRMAENSQGLGNGRGVNDGGRDLTHLWHEHLSVLRKYTQDWVALSGLLSVISGESFSNWLAKNGSKMLAECKIGDTGSHVHALQRMLAACGLDPGSFDGVYGDRTATALAAIRGGDGGEFGPVGYVALHETLNRKTMLGLVREEVTTWLENHKAELKGDPGKFPSLLNIHSGVIRLED